jgi:hypothetical protein
MPRRLITIEDHPERGRMFVQVRLSNGRSFHGQLSDAARAAILDALAELEDEEEDE